jgi:prepilin-type N-terminal cleavage/methylation domain-containing protein/prepilin-type processing-associated H-X9-DG protein
MERSVATGARFVPNYGLKRAGFVGKVAAGFTLVELLVVIGIIAVLISILLPALSRTRDQANAIKCLANMKQIGTAFVLYVNDNKGAMPYVVNESYWKQWAPAFFGNPNSPDKLAPTAQYPDGAPSPQINNVHRHLMKYLGGKVRQNELQITLPGGNTVYRCPSAVDFPTAQNGPQAFSNTNYTFNGVFLRRKVNNFKRPTEFIIASEGRYAWNASAMRPFPVANDILTANFNTLEYRQWMWVESGGTAGYSPLLNLTLHRGNKAGNVIYLDGHAGTVDHRDIRPKDFGLTDSAINGQGLETDTYVRLIGPGGGTLSYRAKIN